MDHVALYNKVCAECSKLITNRYSTSFSLGIRAFHNRFRPPIYAIYGFVRFADEIVDTFHDHPKEALLDRFWKETFQAIEEKISLNPVLHAFQEVVHKYQIEPELITAFLDSMKMDLSYQDYCPQTYKRYIYGSAEVVGLMCLRVFSEGNDALYQQLKGPACSLGSAFQKVNFLRDMKSDFKDRGRIYFPGVNYAQFSLADKLEIEKDIEKDFNDAYKGILMLPKGARFGVYLAYVYYTTLFTKIKQSSVQTVTEERIRVTDSYKMYLLFSSAVKNRFNLIR